MHVQERDAQRKFNPNLLRVMERFCLTPQQAAEVLGRTRWDVYYHLRKGHLRKRKVGNKIFIAKWEVEKLKTRNMEMLPPRKPPEERDISHLKWGELHERFDYAYNAAKRLGIKLRSLSHHFRRGNLALYLYNGIWFVEKQELEALARRLEARRAASRGRSA